LGADRVPDLDDKMKGLIPMSVMVTSTKAKVRDPEKVRAVLESYQWEGIEVELHEGGQQWVLAMAFEEGDFDWWEWPLALHRGQWPSEDRYPDEEKWDEETLGETEWDRAYEEKGAEGFLALLRDLAPYLETPLLILVTIRDISDHSVQSQAWSVHPGAKEVETLGISL
jgi:hypothetical protein